MGVEEQLLNVWDFSCNDLVSHRWCWKLFARFKDTFLAHLHEVCFYVLHSIRHLLGCHVRLEVRWFLNLLLLKRPWCRWSFLLWFGGRCIWSSTGCSGDEQLSSRTIFAGSHEHLKSLLWSNSYFIYWHFGLMPRRWQHCLRYRSK